MSTNSYVWRFCFVSIEIGICECGKPCKLDGGMAGTCQADGVTCSLTREMPVCRDGKLPMANQFVYPPTSAEKAETSNLSLMLESF